MQQSVYYQLLFDFIEAQPEINTEMEKLIARKEQELEIKFPAALREFYVYDDSQDLSDDSQAISYFRHLYEEDEVDAISTLCRRLRVLLPGHVYFPLE